MKKLISSRAITGQIDRATAEEIVGWAVNTVTPEQPVRLMVHIDREVHIDVTADICRRDVEGAGYPSAKVGFHVTVPERFRDGRPHSIRLSLPNGEPLGLCHPMTGAKQVEWVIDVASPSHEPVSAPAETPSTIVAHIDAVEAGVVRGWAYDAATPDKPCRLQVYVDGEFAAEIICQDRREDVCGAGHPSALVGFTARIPATYLDERLHRLELRNRLGGLVFFGDAAGKPVASLEFRLSPILIKGFVDGLHDGAIHGWVFRQDLAGGTMTGSQTVLVSHHGRLIRQLTANRFRPDAAEAYNCDPNCGFAFVPPPGVLLGEKAELTFTVIPGGIELENSPYTASFPSVEVQQKLHDVLDVVEQSLAQIWDLRKRVKGVLPGPCYSLENYNEWAQGYFKALAARPPSPCLANHAEAPLVSVICPTYRPRLKDFVAATESVLAQTYTNWELVIVDDASGSPELTAQIKAFALRDSRIRPVTRRKNGGISAATNTGLKMAKGRYVAFFDHDDLLEARALELMTAEALRTGTKLLYCDEDKIDDAGVLCEVNLKPDWNYRLLLSQNYVCHMLFVERAVLAKVGPLRSECDGAQDHDLILRLAEIVPPEEIYHVPEILYHWRKTPASTAASAGAKTYTVQAGIRAVSDHLKRKGIPAEVSSPLAITCYDVRWKLKDQPKVSIIVPYREHIEMTRTCVQALLNVTDYAAFEILLVDNWSTSDEALAFAAEMNATTGVRVIRVEESFNFSRINNLAAGKSDGVFLLFLNNDVVVSEPSWLRAMVGEALADPSVAIVGSKLLYPNGTVQHAGVILGVGGIADHAFRGLAANAPGYMARAICAQEYSAVTAACMLCRRDVFERVGGFDEKELAVAFNDVDLCLKARAAGYRVVWTPAAVAEHRESMSRGKDLMEAKDGPIPARTRAFVCENQAMEDRWKSILSKDPYYNAHFSRACGIFSDLHLEDET